VLNTLLWGWWWPVGSNLVFYQIVALVPEIMDSRVSAPLSQTYRSYFPPNWIVGFHEVCEYVLCTYSLFSPSPFSPLDLASEKNLTSGWSDTSKPTLMIPNNFIYIWT
jgi:hypothetical protein